MSPLAVVTICFAVCLAVWVAWVFGMHRLVGEQVLGRVHPSVKNADPAYMVFEVVWPDGELVRTKVSTLAIENSYAPSGVMWDALQKQADLHGLPRGRRAAYSRECKRLVRKAVRQFHPVDHADRSPCDYIAQEVARRNRNVAVTR